MSRLAAAVLTALALWLLAVPLATAAPPYALESPLTTGPGAQQSPDLGLMGWGWPVVSEDDSSGSWRAVASWGGQSLTVPTSAGAQRHPAVFQNLLAYEDDRNGDWDIYRTWLPLPGFTAPAEQDLPLATGPGDQLDPAVYGDTVVYESGASGQRDICARSVSTGGQRRITSDAADQVDPAIEGDVVVFADHRNGNWDIYSFNLATGKTARLTKDGSAQQAPQIGHGIVVYQDNRNGNWDIYSLTLRTGKESRLTSDAHDQTRPAIGAGRSVVYQSAQGASSDIYVYDLQTGVTRPVTDDAAAQTAPDVAGDTVVWVDERSGDADIYGCTLQYPTLTLRRPYETPAYGSTVRLTGGLTFSSPAPASATVSLQVGTTTHKVSVGPFDYLTGSYALSLKNVVRKTTVTARYTGGSTQLPATPVNVTILPKAFLGRPILTEVKQPTSGLIPFASLKASGVLKPRHKAGSAAATLQVWVKDFLGDWRLAKSLRAKVHDQNGASAYSLTVVPRMNPGWSYKILAVHGDADHARTESAFSNVAKL